MSGFYIVKECLQCFLSPHLLSNFLCWFMKVLIISARPHHKLLKNAVLQFEAHRSVVIDFRSQSLNKIGVVITRVELDKLHLFFLLVSERFIIVNASVADNIRSDFLRKI